MKNITVEIIAGDYCECGCKGTCDTREVKITKGKKSVTLGIEEDLTDFLQKISKKKTFSFEINPIKK